MCSTIRDIGGEGRILRFLLKDQNGQCIEGEGKKVKNSLLGLNMSVDA